MSSQPELVHADPASLRTVANIRTDLHLTPEFLDSVATLGVQVPIVAVRTDDGALAIAHGHRRAAAAQRAGLASVPVMVLPEHQSETTRLLAQLAENQARAAVTTAEAVAAHEQLALLGVSIADAARATGTSRTDVTAARAIAAAPTTRGHHLATLDLEQAASLAEFDDDPDLLAELAELAADAPRDEFRRAVQRARDDRTIHAALQTEAQKWTDAGYAVAVHANWTPLDPDWWPLWKLTDPQGEELSNDTHHDCPGRAVTIAPHWRVGDPPSIRHHCVDPEEHGHSLPPLREAARTESETPEQRAAHRAEVIERNKQWRAAETVRREHVRTWLATAKPTPALTRWLLTEQLTAPATGDHRLLEQLRELGWASDVLRPAPEPSPDTPTWPRPALLHVHTAATGPRATIGVLTLLLADRELATGVHSWRNPSPASTTARYLTFLAEHTGYTLGDVEQIAVGQTLLVDEHEIVATPNELGEAIAADPLNTDPLQTAPPSTADVEGEPAQALR